MKAPSVRRTRPSEVTRLSLPIQQTCPPGTGPAAPGAGVCPAPRLFPSTGLLLSPSTSWSTQLPFLLFFPAGTLPPLCQAVFSLTSNSSQAGALCSSPCKAGLIFAAVLPLGWDGPFLCRLQIPLFLHTVCPPQPIFSLGGGRAEPCPALQHPAVELMGEMMLFGGLQGERAGLWVLGRARVQWFLHCHTRAWLK